VQWMTAGNGIVHQEFHSQDFTRKGGTLQMVHSAWWLCYEVPGPFHLTGCCSNCVEALGRNPAA
jgi:hypothetical protein